MGACRIVPIARLRTLSVVDSEARYSLFHAIAAVSGAGVTAGQHHFTCLSTDIFLRSHINVTFLSHRMIAVRHSALDFDWATVQRDVLCLIAGERSDVMTTREKKICSHIDWYEAVLDTWHVTVIDARMSAFEYAGAVFKALNGAMNDIRVATTETAMPTVQARLTWKLAASLWAEPSKIPRGIHDKWSIAVPRTNELKARAKTVGVLEGLDRGFPHGN
jgi:hypothetical protein